ncbi:AprI/Inh family metalloprotease inhibitor [Methylobacterium sp. ID0610]|uniref:AprI/Inh family metalloprotease inhibitor n=1 Tax=Methylobacterium carpenticola TaxID=3344827 RepID=UPI0036C1C039
MIPRRPVLAARGALAAGAVVAAGAALAVPAARADPARPRTDAEAQGTWTLSLNGSHRRCVVTLTGEAVAGGHALRFPAGCRRALPVLNGLAGWRLEDGALRLLSAEAKAVLDFALTETPGPLKAEVGPAETYGLEPEGPRAAPPLPPPPPPVTPAAATQAAPAADAPVADGVAGVYALDRYAEKDTCRLALDPGGLRVLEGCRDLGLTVFDPVSWHYETGRITLVARRGHVVTLVPESEGRWRREPQAGTAFMLRRVTP